MKIFFGNDGEKIDKFDSTFSDKDSKPNYPQQAAALAFLMKLKDAQGDLPKLDQAIGEFRKQASGQKIPPDVQQQFKDKVLAFASSVFPDAAPPAPDQARAQVVPPSPRPGSAAKVRPVPGKARVPSRGGGAGGTGAGGPAPGGFASEALIERFQGDNPYAYQRLGEAGLKANDDAAAYRSFSKAIELGAPTADNYYFKGLAAQRLGDFRQANKEARLALLMDPEDARALALFKLTRGRASTVKLELSPGALGNPGAGLMEAEEFGGLPGKSSSVAAAPRDPVAVIEAVKKQAAVDPVAASKSLAREAGTSLQVRDADAAILLAAKAVEYNPANAQAYHLMAIAESNKGDYGAAAADATKAHELAPESVAPLNTRAWARNGMMNYREALSDALSVLRMKPGDGFGLLNQARAQSGLGQRAAMLASLRQAASADARYAQAYENALQLPEDADTNLLFTGTPGAPAPGSGVRAGREGRAGRHGLWTVIGGLLAALGFLHIFSAGRRERVNTALRRMLAAGLPAGAGPPDDGRPGGFWNQYDYKREIAIGGMGVVYEAVDRGLGRRVAVKKLRDEVRSDARERDRFLKEARTVAAMRHPNIVEIYSIVEEGPDIYLVFEYVEGKTLRELVAERGSLPFDEALRIFRGICAALAYSHERGVIHRDLKPANVMVEAGGAVKVMDFGVARQAQEAATHVSRTNTVCGTPPYMAPEQEQGAVCRETDIFALGVCLYQALTGRLPFEGAAGAMLLSKLAGDFPPPSAAAAGLQTGLDGVVRKALAPDPKARWRAPGEFLAALEGLAAEAPKA